MDFGRNAGMQREAIYHAAPLFKVACGQGSQRKHVAPLSQTNNDPVRHRRPTQLIHQGLFIVDNA
jgi:hypothetical protein